VSVETLVTSVLDEEVREVLVDASSLENIEDTNGEIETGKR